MLAPLAQMSRLAGVNGLDTFGLLARFGRDVADASPLTDRSLYSGRITHHPDGGECLLAFRNASDTSPFEGSITDPLRLTWHDSNLVLAQDAALAHRRGPA